MAAENFKVKKGLEVGTGITANSDGVDVTGIVTATQFVGDGSGLTGIVGSGSGVVVKDEGSAVGTAGTINFVGTGVSAALSAGTATVTINAGGLDNVVEDTNPQLGGDLNLNSKFVTGSGGINVTGVVTATTLKGNGDFVDIDVDGLTNLDDVIITGFTTFAAGTKFFNHTPRIEMQGNNTAILSFVNATTGTTTGDGMLMGFSSSSQVGFINVNEPSHGFILKVGGSHTSAERINISGVGTVSIRKGTTEEMITARPDGAVELYFDGNQKLTTTINGIEVPDLNVTGVGTVGRLETNGVTLGTNNNTFAAKFIDDAVANFGTDNDLKISHDDTHARITNTKGDIVVSGIISATSDVKVGSAITMDPTSGIITATAFHGDGSNLSGISGGGSVTSDAQFNTVGGTNAGNSFSGTSANSNTLFGYDAGTNITTADRNTFIGFEAGKAVTAGITENVFIGYKAGLAAQTSQQNVSVGSYTLQNMNHSSHKGSTAIGHYSLYTQTSGKDNVGLGRFSGYNVTQGEENVFLGSFAGKDNITTGSNNIIIGYNATGSSATVSNEITLGNSSITKLRIPGIGVTFKDNGGTPTQGHVLTVDANGEASFAAASGGGGGATDKIEEGNTKAEVSDSGTDGKFFVETEGTERFSIDSTGDFAFNNCSDSFFNAGGNLTIDYKTNDTIKLRKEVKSTAVNFVLFGAPLNIWNDNDDATTIGFYRGDRIQVGTAASINVNGNIRTTGIVTATTFSGSGASLTSLDAGNLGIGTIPNGRFPATLPAASGANLTSLTAGNISGTLATGQIADNAVTFAKMQDVGTGVFIGRNDSGSGDIETLTAAEARTLLNVADGATAGITTASSNIQATWDVIHNSASAYRFTGPGQDGAENNPDIYLVRGHKYRFSLSSTSGSHPLQIKDTGGTAYTDGVTYSDTGNSRTTAGNDLDISVQHDAPAALKYHCTVHPAMVGNIYIVGQHLANGADNRVVTATSAYGMTGESGLTYNGSYLGVTGDIAVSTANRVYFGNSDVAWVKGEHGSSGYLELGVNTGHVRILRSGDVGIGTDNPESKLTVAGDSATAQIEIKRTNTNSGGSIGALNFTAFDGHSVANIFAIADGDNEGAHLVFKTTTAAGENSPYGSNTLERLKITNVGRVYIGGQSGRSPGGLTPQFQIEGIDVGTSSMSLTRNSANSGGASIILNKTRGTAVNADTAVKGGDTLGILQFAGNDGGDSDNAAAWVLAKVDDATSQTMTSNEMPGRLEFYTRSDTSSGSLLERLRIDSTGLITVNRDGVGGRIDGTAGDASIKISDGNGRSSIKVSDPGSGNSYEWELTSAGNFKAPAGATKGIDFSAKSNLGGATDTTLAHYEEGTWTPSFANLDVPGHVTTNWATYTRVGRIVTISVKFTVSSSINDGSGFGFVLPFGPISDRQIVIPAISDRSGSNKAPFAFNNANSDHTVYAKALEGYAFQNYNSFSGNYIIATGSYETDA